MTGSGRAMLQQRLRHTILLIEQAATTATALADRTAILVGGRIVLQGGRDELLASADVCHDLGITDASPAPQMAEPLDR